jgi:hypothetical protein
MISFIGGTGKLGLGLAMRFALAGEAVAIGSRELEKASRAVGRIKARLPGAKVVAMLNQEAVEKSKVVFLTVPYRAQRRLLISLEDHLNDKILVSVVNPFRCVDGEFRSLPIEAGSAAEEAQALLPKARVVSAFKNISHEVFAKIEEPLNCDTIVCSDHEEAKLAVMELARKIGVTPLDGGKLRSSRYLEAITVLLLNLNQKYRGNACLKIEFHRS